jgi:indolepyruvate ferredoxin oxidoreductase alpha subunit
LRKTEKVLIVEEVLPFMEDNIKALAAERSHQIGNKRFFGRKDGTLPPVNELDPDLVAGALTKILDRKREMVAPAYARRAEEIAASGAPTRELTFCPGCPHRASFWTIHTALAMDHRKGFVCGDIGCYTMGIVPTGFNTLKTVHAMGSGAGLASGFGKLAQFGMHQPVMAMCGDSTFYHAVMPALVNAVHSRSDITLVVVDNSGTAMTGFQPHPGLSVDATGNTVPPVSIPDVCRAFGARVEIEDPFDVEQTRGTLLDLLEDEGGVKVLVLRQTCALSPEKKRRQRYEVSVDDSACLGAACGCNRLCTRVFKCPGLIWDESRDKTHIDDVICVGCGVCASVCPTGAIQAREAVS